MLSVSIYLSINKCVVREAYAEPPLKKKELAHLLTTHTARKKLHKKKRATLRTRRRTNTLGSTQGPARRAQSLAPPAPDPGRATAAPREGVQRANGPVDASSQECKGTEGGR